MFPESWEQVWGWRLSDGCGKLESNAWRLEPGQDAWMSILTAQGMDQRIGESLELLNKRLDEMGEPEETVKHPVSGRSRLPLEQNAQKEKQGQ